MRFSLTSFSPLFLQIQESSVALLKYSDNLTNSQHENIVLSITNLILNLDEHSFLKKQYAKAQAVSPYPINMKYKFFKIHFIYNFVRENPNHQQGIKI